MSPFIKKHGAVKVVVAFIIALLAIAVIALPISAEEIIEPPVTDTVGGENLPSADDNGSGEVNTPPATENEPVGEPDGMEGEGIEADIFTRVFEFVEANITEMLVTIALGVLGIGAPYLKSKFGTLISGIGRVLKSQGGVAESNAEVAASQKDIAEKQEKLGGDVENLAKELAEAKKVIAALNAGVTTVIEVLHIITINNRNVPQPMKNLTTSKYARYLSTINDDPDLKATYDKMRGILGVTEGAPNEETNT